MSRENFRKTISSILQTQINVGRSAVPPLVIQQPTGERFISSFARMVVVKGKGEYPKLSKGEYPKLSKERKREKSPKLLRESGKLPRLLKEKEIGPLFACAKDIATNPIRVGFQR